MERLGGSFRDPSGFVFRRDGRLYRQVNRAFAAEFDACVASGLYDALAGDGLLVGHRLADPALALTPDAHAVIEPEPVPFVSYPYEWCFGALRDAALLTLDVQLRALERGFVLRDATAYNVQLVGARPVFIDTLSFARYAEGEPWAAYHQFCEHFLAPLALMAARDPRLGLMLREHLEGVPLDLASALLPRRTWADPLLLLHVHLHARAQRRYAEASVRAAVGRRTLPKPALVSLVGSLRRAVAGLDWRPRGTTWADYAQETNYSDAAAARKRELVGAFLRRVGPATVWDLGANTGVYSRAAREVASNVIAFDSDAAAVERHYRSARDAADGGVLPLMLDLRNPSPALGWAHAERMSLAERGPADAVLALALVHHLAIAGNVPLADVAAFLARIGRSLVVEFVEKGDSQVRRLLRNREDVFPDYTREGFAAAFGRHFEVDACERVGDADRWLYLMRARAGGAAAGAGA